MPIQPEHQEITKMARTAAARFHHFCDRSTSGVPDGTWTAVVHAVLDRLAGMGYALHRDGQSDADREAFARVIDPLTMVPEPAGDLALHAKLDEVLNLLRPAVTSDGHGSLDRA